ncbi:MAG: class I SAM-dependent methyltransferase [Candidatus Altiarchaeota archaeon]|nr:class I SAM-dependent methyltransferase [Candidatus Altiarchaeota archaeon]
MKGDWFNVFKKEGKLYLNEDVYNKAYSSFMEDLPVYLKHVKEGDKVLECCCGPGYTAVPMSHHFNVTGFDRDKKVLNAARENARKFGKNISLKEADFFDIVEVFGKDSFHACSSGGVLEHFAPDKIKKLMDLQLQIAPIVFASMPLFTDQDVETRNTLGIETFKYDEKNWTDDLLKEYNILGSRVLDSKPIIGKFREYMVVIGR